MQESVSLCAVSCSLLTKQYFVTHQPVPSYPENMCSVRCFSSVWGDWVRLLLLRLSLWVLLKPAIETEAHNAEEGFREYTTTHLTNAFTTINKDDWNLFNLKAYLVRGVLHLYLESISFKPNII